MECWGAGAADEVPPLHLTLFNSTYCCCHIWSNINNYCRLGGVAGLSLTMHLRLRVRFRLWSVAKSPRVAEQCDVNINSTQLNSTRFRLMSVDFHDAENRHHQFP
ncbi:hypothetical protein TNCV_4933001 [Trichonephila clavipes]|nr:hypothetical protein TNCV_4933001 [Trichonephila clavipes]